MPLKILKEKNRIKTKLKDETCLFYKNHRKIDFQNKVIYIFRTCRYDNESTSKTFINRD